MLERCSLSLERQRLYGMPHLGAVYDSSGYHPTTRRCVLCGKEVTNCHHVAHRKWGKSYRLRTKGFPGDVYELRSPLFALCGSGTDGCHNGFHGGATNTARWVWDSEENEEAWWDGTMLHDFEPHSPELFRYGHWEIEARLPFYQWDDETGRWVLAHYVTAPLTFDKPIGDESPFVEETPIVFGRRR